LNCLLPVYSVNLEINSSERRPCTFLSRDGPMSWADFYVLRKVKSVGNAGAGGSTIVGVRLDGDSLVVEFRWLLGLAAGCGLCRGPALVRWLLGLAAGCGLCRGSALVTTVQSLRLAVSFSPRWWWCSVVFCVCVLFVWCTLRRVMYEYFFLFLLICQSSAPAIISKKK
jgi:hypothetical protein